jgi:hypothetical protein
MADFLPESGGADGFLPAPQGDVEERGFSGLGVAMVQVNLQEFQFFQEVGGLGMEGLPLRLLTALWSVRHGPVPPPQASPPGPWAPRDYHEHQAHQAALIDEIDLLKARLNRLFRKSEDLHSSHISLGCIQESIRLLALQAKIRHSLNHRR